MAAATVRLCGLCPLLHAARRESCAEREHTAHAGRSHAPPCTGLFATETVEEGQVVFHEKDVFEQKIPHSEVVDFLRGLPVAEARNILHHSYAQDDMFHWCKDTVALFNHSDEPTVVRP